MIFDPATQQMICEYCGQTMTLADYNDTLKEKGQFIATEYNCAQCGATILATDATAATFCSYCGSPVALTGNMTAQKAPKKIIPFKFTKKQALFQYENKVRKSFFAPDWMLDPEAEQRFRGIYMPYYSHTLKGQGFYKGNAIARYSSGSYDYTDTYDIESPVTATFKNIVTDASVAFPDTMSYNLGKPDEGKEVTFMPSYLSGFYADVSDIREDHMMTMVNSIATQELLRSSTTTIPLRGHTASVNIGPALADMTQKGLEVETDTVMNPVWFMSNRRRDKISYAAVDGVDGDVAVDIPIDFKKYLLVAVLVCGFLAAIFNLLNFVPTPEAVLNMSWILAVVGWIISSREYGKLWRRKHGYDDLGAMDEDTFLKVQNTLAKPLKRLSNRAEKAKTKAKGMSGCLMIILIIVAIPIIPFVFSIGMLLFPFFLVYAIIKAIVNATNGKNVKNSAKVKEFKAPFLSRFLNALPFIAVIILSLTFQDMYAENDTMQYAMAFAGIGVNVLMYLNIVRMQNAYAMRDIPVFTQKRGGDM